MLPSPPLPVHTQIYAQSELNHVMLMLMLIKSWKPMDEATIRRMI